MVTMKISEALKHFKNSIFKVRYDPDTKLCYVIWMDGNVLILDPNHDYEIEVV